MIKKKTLHKFYTKLLKFYPKKFREQFEDSMTQTFSDLYQERQTQAEWLSFIPWIFFETALGIMMEHVRLMMEGDTMKNTRFAALVSSILVGVSFIVAPLIYLVGNLRDAMGPFAYNLADFLYGPVWAVSLVSVVFVLRERFSERAPRRMSLALLATVLAAGTMILIACIRSANRQYHLLHPELHLENSSTVLIVWTTLISGLTGAGWHFLGWALTLIGSAGWTSNYLPRPLSILYFAAGITSLFVYLLPPNEGLAGMLSVIVMIWQGILLWKAEPEEKQASVIIASQSNQA
jgi:hypothetical protein